MKKKILYYKHGGHAFVSGNITITSGREEPQYEVEIDMDDKKYQELISNPKKYKKQLKKLVKENPPQVKYLTKTTKETKIISGETNLLEKKRNAP